MVGFLLFSEQTGEGLASVLREIVFGGDAHDGEQDEGQENEGLERIDHEL
jgi:hypothetical protein